MIENRALGILDKDTEEILQLVYLLKITKIPFETDCNRRIKIFYPNKENKICEISRNIFSAEDSLDMFWNNKETDYLDFETGIKHFDAYLKLKEYNKTRTKKKKFRLVIRKKIN